MRIWIVGGGTGGHVYPALAVTQALQATDRDTPVDLTWVGGIGGMEADLVARAGLPFRGIPAGGVHGVKGVQALRNGWALVQGVFAALRLVQEERPDVMFTTGGYVSGPVAAACRLRGVPILVFLPDIEPAQSVRFVARIAAQVAVSVEDSLGYLPGKRGIVTGYPLRASFKRWDRDAAREHLALDPEAPVLLVFGGSRGARSINRSLQAHLAELTELAQVVHVSGELDWPEVATARKALPDAVQARYHAFPYVHEMGAALAAADLVVCRSGAAVLAELPYYGLPGILVPYPHAWRYQRVNAAWLSERGAALVVDDADLRETLLPMVRMLLADASRRAEMADAARSLARPDAAEKLAELLFALGQREEGR